MKIVPYLNQSVNCLVYQSVNQFLSQLVSQSGNSLILPGSGLSDLVSRVTKNVNNTVYLLWFKYELKQNKI